MSGIAGESERKRWRKGETQTRNDGKRRERRMTESEKGGMTCERTERIKRKEEQERGRGGGSRR